MSENNQNETFIYLDFGDNLPNNILDDKLFFRVVNLHTPSPLVQVNDFIFEGKFDECIGTNFFFEEIEDAPIRTNIYEKETPIHLKPLVKQSKIIRFKPVKLPNKISKLSDNESETELDLNQKYEKVLEKLEEGTLNFDEIIKKKEKTKEPNSDDEIVNKSTFEQSSICESKIIKNDDCHNEEYSLLKAKYEKLKMLARRPVRTIKEPELVCEPEEKYKEKYLYHNLERTILQSSDAFRKNYTVLNKDNMIENIDIDRCVMKNLIKRSDDLNRTLTDDEIKNVLTLDNLENLSLIARYTVLIDSLRKIEEIKKTATETELNNIDENNLSINKIYEILKKLINALEIKINQSQDISVTFSGSRNYNFEYIKINHEDRPDLADDDIGLFNPDDWTDDDSKEGKSNQDDGVKESDFRENWSNDDEDNEENDEESDEESYEESEEESDEESAEDDDSDEDNDNNKSKTSDENIDLI